MTHLMIAKNAAKLVFLVITAISSAQVSSRTIQRFDNQYLKIDIVPGWKLQEPQDRTITLVGGKYLLSIDAVFLHASPVEGGRFDEIVNGKSSIEAVMANVDRPASGVECADSHANPTVVTKKITLSNFYTDKTRTGKGCVFPRSPQPVWFGSICSGVAAESDFAITLTYDTTDVNQLPTKGSPELTRVFEDVTGMLKTLQLKPPIVISKVEPGAARPGEDVVIYGSGFHALNRNADVQFEEYPNIPMPPPVIAPDGKSLTFRVPASVETISCASGQVYTKGFCVPKPPSSIDVNDCPVAPNRSTNVCGTPIPPATYHLSLTNYEISTSPVPFTVMEPAASPVSVSLVYSNEGVMVDDLITIRGSGFTATGNTVEIGDAKLIDLNSPDGQTLTFRAPPPQGASFLPRLRIYQAFVRNRNGMSNPITFGYK
jgi:hypothetical protein